MFLVDKGSLQIFFISKHLRTLIGATESAVLSLLPSLGANCGLGIKDAVRIVFRLDLLQCRVVSTEKVFLEIGLMKVGLEKILTFRSLFYMVREDQR
jgi:hypothetical protein